MILDFFGAKHKHLIWTIKLKAYLLDIQDIRIEEAISHKSCLLGQWIYEFGLEKYKEYPEMLELESVHKELHFNVQSIIELKSNGYLEEAVTNFDNLKKISDRIITLLDKLEEFIESKNKNNYI